MKGVPAVWKGNYFSFDKELQKWLYVSYLFFISVLVVVVPCLLKKF
jgi:hypothetical protein